MVFGACKVLIFMEAVDYLFNAEKECTASILRDNNTDVLRAASLLFPASLLGTGSSACRSSKAARQVSENLERGGKPP